MPSKLEMLKVFFFLFLVFFWISKLCYFRKSLVVFPKKKSLSKYYNKL